MDVSNCIVYYINDKQKSVFLITLQHIKAIINCDSLVLMDSDHPAIQEFIPELEVRCHGSLSHSCVSHPSTPQSSLPSFLPLPFSFIPSSLLPSSLPLSFLPSFLHPPSPFTLLFLFQERLKSSIDVTLPFEFRALETMLMKIVSIHLTSYPGHFLSSHVAWV